MQSAVVDARSLFAALYAQEIMLETTRGFGVHVRVYQAKASILASAIVQPHFASMCFKCHANTNK